MVIANSGGIFVGGAYLVAENVICISAVMYLTAGKLHTASVAKRLFCCF